MPVRYVVALGLVVSVLSVAWGFTGIEGELRLRDQGLALNDVDLALDAAVASRAHLGEALRVAAFGDALRPADVERSLSAALALAERELTELLLRIDLVTARKFDAALGGAHQGYADAAAAVVRALEKGDVGTADAVFAADLDQRHAQLSQLLAAERAAVFAAFSGSQGTGYLLSLVTRFLLAVAIPLAAIFVIFDAMRRRQRHRELELQLRAERDLSRAKDEFIANVSHELRTPLTIVHGFATVLEEEGALPDHIADAAAFIARESDELTRMVDDLLTAARTDAGALTIRVEPVPIRQAIEAVVTAMSSESGSIEMKLEPAYVYADPFRLRQIVRNLLSNAGKHGGSAIRVSGEVDRHEYVLTVADDGPGIDPELGDRIFERFVHGARGRLLVGSVGLGLAIVESLVHRMNGTISHDRVDGETRFCVRLPLSPVGYAVRSGELILEHGGDR